jgi:hypothetical protein
MNTNRSHLPTARSLRQTTYVGLNGALLDFSNHLVP